MRLLLGDCLDKLKELDDNSVDSIVTDPPYGLSFMGKKWDYDVPSQEIFEECLRVLKPGGHLLSFAGSRTYHRMAVRVEDAGFEIRDQIMWIYGSGFPKSLNIGKAVDKQGGNSLGNEVAELVKKKRLEMGLSTIQLAELGKFYGNTNHGGTVSNWETGRGSITPEQFNKLIEILNLENNPIIETKREVLGKLKTNLGVMQNIGGDYTPGEIEVTKGNTEWEGWGTALKPAHEPIVMARKPLSEKTVVDNVLEWGTGGINIDESRIGTDEELGRDFTKGKSDIFGGGSGIPGSVTTGNPQGRFPANIIFDEEAGKILDEQSGILVSKWGKPSGKKTKSMFFKEHKEGTDLSTEKFIGDSGGASRFFYCPKTSKTDRNEGLDGFEEKRKSHITSQNFENALTGAGNTRNPYSKNFHPTVKPTDLMLYLIRLVTPKGGTTLDPFMGSGSTGKAAVRGGFDFVGIEREEEYMEIAEARIQYEIDNPYNEEKGERVEVNKNSNKFW
jgi:DNA modification methylase/transcriptional regulator with XRE-family HTH domain